MEQISLKSTSIDQIFSKSAILEQSFPYNPNDFLNCKPLPSELLTGIMFFPHTWQRDNNGVLRMSDQSKKPKDHQVLTNDHTVSAYIKDLTTEGIEPNPGPTRHKKNKDASKGIVIAREPPRDVREVYVTKSDLAALIKNLSVARSIKPRIQKVLQPGSQQLLALVNSFTEPCQGAACVPDGTSGTYCKEIRQELVIGGSTNTMGCIIINPADHYNFFNYNSSATTLTLANNMVGADASSTIDAESIASRCVGACIKVQTTSPYTTNSGSVYAFRTGPGAIPSTVIANASAPVDVCTAAGVIEYKAFRANESFSLSYRAMQAEDFNWISYRAASAKTVAQQSNMIGLCFGPGAVGQTMHITVTANYELKPKKASIGTGAAQGNTHAVPGWYEHVLNGINLVSPWVERVVKVVPGLSAVYEGVKIAGKAVDALVRG